MWNDLFLWKVFVENNIYKSVGLWWMFVSLAIMSYLLIFYNDWIYMIYLTWLFRSYDTFLLVQQSNEGCRRSRTQGIHMSVIFICYDWTKIVSFFYLFFIFKYFMYSMFLNFKYKIQPTDCRPKRMSIHIHWCFNKYFSCICLLYNTNSHLISVKLVGLNVLDTICRKIQELCISYILFCVFCNVIYRK